MAGLISESMKRLGKQNGLLLRMHQAELAKDPNSHATASSRSNMMAVQHTVEQIYGEAVARDVSDLVKPTAPSFEGKPTTWLRDHVRDTHQ
jgi:hypothetical protein